MVSVKINLMDNEWTALADRAEATLRPIDREARWLVRCSLVRGGWLDVDKKAEEECMNERRMARTPELPNLGAYHPNP